MLIYSSRTQMQFAAKHTNFLPSMITPDTANLTAEQIRKRKLTKRGLSLNLLLIGENGCGKKAFVNTLCDKHYFHQDDLEIDDEVVYAGEVAAFNIDTHIINVNEADSVPIRLRVNLTNNFGFNLENSGNSFALEEYIKDEFKSILEEELKINRNPHLEDNRIHIALYFIRACGRRLNEFDIDNMKRIGDKVNMIPVICKADTLTDEEMLWNKRIINESIQEHGISVYNFLESGSESASDFSPHRFDSGGATFRVGATGATGGVEGIANFSGKSGESNLELEEELAYLVAIQNSIPFSIVSANSRNGQTIRKTQWGDIDIEDESVCDFKMLKNVIFGSHIQEFKDTTISRKYEAFRIEQLTTNRG